MVQGASRFPSAFLSRRHWIHGALVVLVLLTWGTGCDDGVSPGPIPAADPIILRPDAGPGDLLDPVSVDSAWVAGDLLFIDVTYSGGCQEHDFQAISPDTFTERIPEAPPQLPVYLRHDGHGDACRTVVTETIVFDVSPAAELFRSTYRCDGWLYLIITAPGLPEPVTTFVLYYTGVGSTPRSDEEAELVAAFLSGRLTACAALYESVRRDLTRIRKMAADMRTFRSRPVAAITFRPPWMPGEVLVTLDPDHSDLVARGLYPYWNELNAALRLTEIDLSLIQYGTAVLRFGGVLHPCELAMLYQDLPGVTWTDRNGRLGDGPTIYPRETDAGRSYLLREAWGDCPAGCIGSEYWYFVDDGTGIEFVGYYDPATDIPVPPWWNEATENIQVYNDRAQCR